MARRNVMQRRHYGNIAMCMAGVLLNTPENDRKEVEDAFLRLAQALAHNNENMDLSEFLNASGIPNSLTNEDTRGSRSDRGGVEGLAPHKRL